MTCAPVVDRCCFCTYPPSVRVLDCLYHVLELVGHLAACCCRRTRTTALENLQPSQVNRCCACHPGVGGPLAALGVAASALLVDPPLPPHADYFTARYFTMCCCFQVEANAWTSRKWLGTWRRGASQRARW